MANVEFYFLFPRLLVMQCVRCKTGTLQLIAFLLWRVSPRLPSQNSGFPHPSQLRPSPNFPRRPLLSLAPSPVLPRGIRLASERLRLSTFPLSRIRSFKKLALLVHHAHRRTRHHPPALLRHLVFEGGREGSSPTSGSYPTLRRSRLDF